MCAVPVRTMSTAIESLAGCGVAKSGIMEISSGRAANCSNRQVRPFDLIGHLAVISDRLCAR